MHGENTDNCFYFYNWESAVSQNTVSLKEGKLVLETCGRRDSWQPIVWTHLSSIQGPVNTWSVQHEY